jgi:hypothetical protein
VANSELMTTTLKGFMKECTSLIKGIVGQETLLLIGHVCGMNYFRKNFYTNILMEVETIMMTTLLFPARQRRASSKIFSIEILPLNMTRRRT